MRSRPPLWTLAATALAVTLVADAARAAPPSAEDAAAAEALFEQGRALMERQEYDAACAKFAASQKVAPGVGTLLNLGDCYERAGRTASAWATFRSAVAAAQGAKRPDREQTARARAAALEPKLPRLIIEAPASVTVRRDGNRLNPGELGTALPVDPGAHVVEASAPGKKTWSQSVIVGTSSRTAVTVPSLEDGPGSDGAAAVASPPSEDRPAGEAPSAEPPGESQRQAESHTEPQGAGVRRALAVGLAGVGVVGLGVGTFFGLRASSAWSDAKSHCVDLECDQTGVDSAATAKSSGLVSTVAFVAGGAALVAGAVLWFTTPKASVRVAVSPLGIGLAGAM